jgi:hypothetical protein
LQVKGDKNVFNVETRIYRDAVHGVIELSNEKNATTYMCISGWRCGTNDGAIVSLINPAG